MAMFGSLFGGGGNTTIPTLSDDKVSAANRDATNMTKATPQELEMLAKMGISAEQADQGMIDELRKLGERGDDLGNVDQEYMDRAYTPAYNRLMADYGDMDQGIIENLNKRGIAGVPGGASEPEAYQRSLLARDTKRTLGDNMLTAQNQAVQHKLETYKARMGETDAAARRYDSTMTPLFDKTVVSETDRMANKVGAAGNLYNAKLGYESKMHDINSQRMMQNKQNTMNAIGGGLGVLSAGIGLLSDPDLKTNREAGPDPEQDLAELTETPIDRWKYRWEGPEDPMHQGAMADEAPKDTQTEGGHGIDMGSYMGKITNALKALNSRTMQGGFSSLMERGN